MQTDISTLVEVIDMSANIDEFRKLLKGLSRQEFEEPISEITEQLEKSIGLNNFLNTCAENRFSEGVVCPYCGKEQIVKLGRVMIYIRKVLCSAKILE